MPPKLSSWRVQLETGAGTKAISVTWELADNPAQPPADGEWAVEWDDMYADLPDDVRSAQSESGGGYFALQREMDTARTPKAHTSHSHTHPHTYPPARTPAADPLPPPPPPPPPPPRVQGFDGPLSTARLLEIENGPGFAAQLAGAHDGGGASAVDEEDLPAFFAARPIVQAPAQILPDARSAGKKTEVLFLLAPATPIPPCVRILFTPTWSPPHAAPALLAQIPISDYAPADGLHTAWATRRLEDLQALQEIARELEREGSRGLGLGRLKVGVEGGGMDEEAVRREGWMVGEEQAWVLDRFLTCSLGDNPNLRLPDPHSDSSNDASSNNAAVMDPFAGLGIGSAGKAKNKLNHGEALDRPNPDEEEDADDEQGLFALPLSPRSPDMAMSPFSMFRGEALGGKGTPLMPAASRGGFHSIDTTVDASIDSCVGLGLAGVPSAAPSAVVPTTTTTTTATNSTSGAAPLTPPREA